MKITRISPLTGDTNTMDLPITEEDYNTWADGKALIQNAFPHLSADQREFILSGLMPEEFEKFLGPEDLYDDDMAKKGESYEEKD